jgi:hypothetical protein
MSDETQEWSLTGKLTDFTLHFNNGLGRPTEELVGLDDIRWTDVDAVSKYGPQGNTPAQRTYYLRNLDPQEVHLGDVVSIAGEAWRVHVLSDRGEGVTCVQVEKVDK